MMNARDEILDMTERDIDALIEIADAQNVSGFNSSMLVDSFVEKVDYLLQEEDDVLGDLVARYYE